jgi:hypothetical protein
MHCGLNPVQGYRAHAKFCSRSCNEKARWLRKMETGFMVGKADYPAHVIDALFERAKAAQKAKRWSA